MCVQPQIISTIGLMLDIIGVILLFYFGPPTLPITKDGNTITTFKHPDYVSKNKSKYKRHQIMSFVALGFLLLGFLFQFTGSAMQIEL